jgi:hypothetical protein
MRVERLKNRQSAVMAAQPFLRDYSEITRWHP